MKKNTAVDAFIGKHEQWKEALDKLRALMLSAGLEETIKWGAPAYTVGGKNIAGISAFKSYAGIWFFQGALLKDEHQKLANAQEGKTQAMRQWRFHSADEIDEGLVRAYLAETIQNHKAGKAIKPPRKKPLVIPPELKHALGNNPGLAESFDQLPHGKKRDYAEYISEAKRAATKEQRLEKIIPMILAGKGLNDKYQG